jgi:diguanylate cyclase (GGDEF)-like protein/PAS domain S-box-containing protein
MNSLAVKIPRRAEVPSTVSENQLSTLLDSVRDVILWVGGGGTIRYASPALERVLGYGPDEWVGRSTFEWIHPDDAAEALGTFRQVLGGAAPVKSMDWRVHHRDGSWRMLDVVYTPLREPGAGLVLTARDVTERKDTEATRQHLMATLDATPDLVILSDPRGRVLYVNDAVRTLLGAVPEDLTRCNLPELYQPDLDNQQRLLEGISLARRHGVWRGDLLVSGPEGAAIPVSQVMVAHRDVAGDVEFLSTVARDISERKAAEVALKESEERFRQVAENIEEVFWLLDREQERALFVSPAYEKVWGHSRGILYLSVEALVEHVHPRDAEGIMDDLFLGEGEREYRILRPDGEIRWIRTRSFPVQNATGEVYRIAGISEDITLRKQSDEHLQRLALHDPLTGLPNRAAFIARLGRALGRLEHQSGEPFSVLFVDLDRFKLINDSLGHMKGDELLVSIARRLEQCVRPEDMVARFAGDEFAVLLAHTGRVADAARVAERIVERLEEPFLLGENTVFTGASIGIVPSEGYRQAEDLLRDADIAMYRAKTAGRGVYRVFDAAMHADAVSRLQLEIDLRRALERGEFLLHYQPIVSLAEGRITGFEALIRWMHPEGRMVSPADFIPIAEETGIIVSIGWWVLREACLQLRAYANQFPEMDSLSMSVNFSAKHFTQRDLVSRLRTIVEETGVDPRRLKLEITESVLMENSELVKTVFQELRGMGIQLQIDDFGTGYSSLSYLDRFPVDTLKIDRSLVGRIGPTGEGGEIVRTVAMLAQNLGMTVVAEGVETLSQLEQLRAIGCGYAQGYLFSRPISSDAAEDLLRKMPYW